MVKSRTITCHTIVEQDVYFLSEQLEKLIDQVESQSDETRKFKYLSHSITPMKEGLYGMIVTFSEEIL